MLIYLIPFLFLIILILYSPVSMEIEYSREGQDDDLKLELYTFINFLGISIRIPYLQNQIFSFLMEVFTELDLLFLNIRSGKEIELEKVVDQDKKQINKLKKLLSIIFNRELVNIFFLGIKIECRELRWITEYGLADPAYTAICNGFIWMIKGVFIKLSDELVSFKENIELRVEPDFYNLKFSTYFIGIFSARIGNIIFTMTRVLIYKLKTSLRSRELFSLKLR